MSRRHPKDLILYGLAVTDAAARGKSVAHAEDGRAVLIEGAVPGDTVDVRVTKKSSRHYEGRVERLLTLSENAPNLPAPTSGCAEAAAGKTCSTVGNCTTNNRKSKTTCAASEAWNFPR